MFTNRSTLGKDPATLKEIALVERLYKEVCGNAPDRRPRVKHGLHVFAGTFRSRKVACLHSEPQWEPEPGEKAGDDEYAAWEDRNPKWEFRDDLNVGLDSDFVETIHGKDRYDYLNGYLVDPSDTATVQETADNANTLVLLFPDALHGSSSELKSTSKTIYCGVFDFSWR